MIEYPCPCALRLVARTAVLVVREVLCVAACILLLDRSELAHGAAYTSGDGLGWCNSVRAGEEALPQLLPASEAEASLPRATGGDDVDSQREVLSAFEPRLRTWLDGGGGIDVFDSRRAFSCSLISLIHARLVSHGCTLARRPICPLPCS